MNALFNNKHIHLSDEKVLKQLQLFANVTSDDPRKHMNAQSAVGCLIIHPSGHSTKTANRIPGSIRHKLSLKDSDDPNRYYFIEHAERAAIFEAYQNGEQLAGSKLYVTRFPCADCARAIVISGISSVTSKVGPEPSERWASQHVSAMQILEAAGTNLHVLNLSS